MKRHNAKSVCVRRVVGRWLRAVVAAPEAGPRACPAVALSLAVSLLSPGPAPAAEVDVSKLPPPAKVEVIFDRDIRPIFEKVCWRCHGPERPKSGFNLTTRETALKGGVNGVDIVPGDSARSPLIHYVARLVEDMEMPPAGKADPLTPEEVGLLRAWIDQGVNWSTAAPPKKVSFSVESTLRWISVEGDRGKFREIEGLREGWATGLESFVFRERIAGDKTFSAEGRAIFQDHDYRLSLTLERDDVGFVRGGFEQWRRYFDDTGGFYEPLAQPAFDLNRDLHLDIGRAWIDFGLTLPRWPQMILGYEYQFKEGDKSTLQWGTVSGRKIFPAAKEVAEQTHIIKFDLTHEFRDWRIEDRARVEIFDSRTRRDNADTFTTGPGPNTTVITEEGFQHVQGMNTLRLERQVTGWLLVAGGHLYAKFDGDAAFNQATVNTAGLPAAGTFWFTDDIVLRRESHIFSANSLLTPLDGLSAAAGFQAEWTRQEGFGAVRFDEGDPNQPQNFLLLPATLESDLDKVKYSEELSLRFAKIPFTVLFAEARWEQEQIDQVEQQIGEEQLRRSPAFLRDTDFNHARQDYRAGFNTSPLRWVALNAHYRRQISDNDYDHEVDLANPLTGQPILNDGYSAFIRHREIDTDEVQTRLTLRPLRWLKTSLTYQIVATDYTTETAPARGGIVPGGRLLAGNYDAHVYGVNATLTPVQRLYLSATFNYSDTRTEAADNGSRAVAPYKGDVYSVISSASYVLTKSTDLHASYSFARADYAQDNVAAGLPLGIEFTRHAVSAGLTKRWTDLLTTNLRYGFFDYAEPTAGGINDYTAHGVFVTVAMKWP